MVGMGFTREEVRESLINQKYNEVTATYLLLARKNEVSRVTKSADVINTHHHVSSILHVMTLRKRIRATEREKRCYSFQLECLNKVKTLRVSQC